MNNFFLNNKTPEEYNLMIANRLRVIRKQKKLSQDRLSVKSGVSLGSIKRFECSGEISLKSLVKISIALDLVDHIDKLFVEDHIQSIKEIIDGQN